MSPLISGKLLRRRPQEIGKVKIGRLGAERTSSGGKKFRLPEKLDHFIVTTRHRGDDGNFVVDEEIHGHPDVGSEPVELAGVLMYETPEENFHAEMLQYSGRTKIWSCDGETAANLKTGKCGECPRLSGGDCKCKPYARLHLQLWASPHVFGYHVFRTTGWESTSNIQSALQEIHERFGTCYNAPVKLVIYPAEDTYQEGGKDKTSTSYKVGLVLAMPMEEAAGRMVEAKRRMELARSELRMLAAGVQEDQAQRDEEESDAIAEEFFPEEAVRASIETQERMDGLKAELGVGPAPNGDAAEVEAEIVTPPTPEEIEQLQDLLAQAAEAQLLEYADAEAYELAIHDKNGPVVREGIRELEGKLARSGDEQASLLEQEG